MESKCPRTKITYIYPRIAILHAFKWHGSKGDFSSAAFLLAAAAITSSRVELNNLDYRTIQGDKAIVGILKNMGVNGKVCEDSIEIEGTGNFLKPIEIDAKNIPDLVPAITVLFWYATRRVLPIFLVLTGLD